MGPLSIWLYVNQLYMDRSEFVLVQQQVPHKRQNATHDSICNSPSNAPPLKCYSNVNLIGMWSVIYKGRIIFWGYILNYVGQYDDHFNFLLMILSCILIQKSCYIADKIL